MTEKSTNREMAEHVSASFLKDGDVSRQVQRVSLGEATSLSVRVVGKEEFVRQFARWLLNELRGYCFDTGLRRDQSDTSIVRQYIHILTVPEMCSRIAEAD